MAVAASVLGPRLCDRSRKFRSTASDFADLGLDELVRRHRSGEYRIDRRRREDRPATPRTESGQRPDSGAICPYPYRGSRRPRGKADPSASDDPARRSRDATDELEEKKPQARPGDEMRAWGSGRRCHSPPPHSVFRRDRSGRAAVDPLGGGFSRPNAALAAAEGPQIGKPAGSRRGAREVHRPSAVRAERPDDGCGRRPAASIPGTPTWYLVAVHFKRTNEIQTHV